MAKNTLIMLGSGIKFMSHLTTEAKAAILAADKVLYLINEPAMQAWIKKNSKLSEPLDPVYMRTAPRDENYQSIAEYIMADLYHYHRLCVAVYGHPTVFVQPTVYAARLAAKAGFIVKILPGISAEACLFADLGIDPGSGGCASFEATDFLLYKREHDAGSHLIIWQPFVIGVLGIAVDHDPVPGLVLLRDRLSETYHPEQEVILYEAAQYPTFDPIITRVSLQNLPYANITRLSTLYVPPAKQKEPDRVIRDRLRQITVS